MSFLGSIGHLMAGSGLQELFELIYAPNAVVHMLADKALARVVRAHLTIKSALNALLLSDAMKINLFYISEVEEESTSEVEEESSLLEVVATDLCSRNSDLQDAFVLYENLMNNSLSVHQVCQKEVVQKLKEREQGVFIAILQDCFSVDPVPGYDRYSQKLYKSATQW